MAAEFARFLASDMVELRSDRGESRHFVHKDLLTSQSVPFRDALTGEWKEVSERMIDLGDWDSATVSQMIQFLYRGSYHYPSPVHVSAENTPRVPDIESVVPQPSVARDESPSDMTRPLTPVNECLKWYLPLSVPKNAPVVSSLDCFDPAQYDYREALLSHAKVYHLAHYKAIDPLCTQALQHLLDSLSRIDRIDSSNFSKNVGGVVDLARYVYKNIAHLDNHAEPLRRLISHFIASNYLALKSSTELAQLLGEGGDIVVDVMDCLYRGTPAPLPSIRPGSENRNEIRYIANLCVSNGPEPSDYVRELSGTSGNPNWGISNCLPLWLYAEYTTDAKSACTAFILETGDCTTSSPYTVDIGYNRQILCVKDLAVKTKITEIALLRGRCKTLVNIPVNYGTFDGMTGDLVGRLGNEYLYIVWKSVVVT